jgi:DNA-binding transcriptional LysR family regulator
VILLTRTTRSVSLTDARRRLVDGAGPSLGQLANVIQEVSTQPGEAVGRLRLTIPRSAAPFVVEPVLPTFRMRHPRRSWRYAGSEAAEASARRKAAP